jgi:hypothetical protein
MGPGAQRLTDDCCMNEKMRKNWKCFVVSESWFTLELFLSSDVVLDTMQ